MAPRRILGENDLEGLVGEVLRLRAAAESNDRAWKARATERVYWVALGTIATGVSGGFEPSHVTWETLGRHKVPASKAVPGLDHEWDSVRERLLTFPAVDVVHVCGNGLSPGEAVAEWVRVAREMWQLIEAAS